jgi:hypothetical protein
MYKLTIEFSSSSKASRQLEEKNIKPWMDEADIEGGSVCRLFLFRNSPSPGRH